MKDRCVLLEALIDFYLQNNEISKLVEELKNGNDRQLIADYQAVQSRYFLSRFRNRLKNQF